jgi:hypothetical protein
MRRTVAVTMLVGLASWSTEAGGQSNQLRVQIPGFEWPVQLDTISISYPLTGDRTKILAAIDAAFAHFELPVEAFDASVGRAPNRRVTKTRRLGKQMMSRYLDCGRGFAGNNADVYRIILSAAAWPEPATGDVTALKVAIIAAGQDQAGARNDYVLCTSRGAFEREFIARVRELIEQGRGDPSR